MHTSSNRFLTPYFDKIKLDLFHLNKINKASIIEKTRPYYLKYAEFIIKNRISKNINFDNVSVISLNWDTLLEDSIYLYKKQFKRNIDIDYCCYTNPLTYDTPHTTSITQKSRNIFNIKIMKLHGSANWLVCPNCNRLFTGIGSKIDRITLYIKPLSCPKCKKLSNSFLNIGNPELIPIIITPTFLKKVDNTHINMVWHNAYVELSEASKIVFIGYSLPNADYLIRTLLKRSIQKNTIIEVVLIPSDYCSKNTKSSYRNFYSSERYKYFFPESHYSIKFYKNGVSDYISNYLNNIE